MNVIKKEICDIYSAFSSLSSVEKIGKYKLEPKDKSFIAVNLSWLETVKNNLARKILGVQPDYFEGVEVVDELDRMTLQLSETIQSVSLQNKILIDEQTKGLKFMLKGTVSLFLETKANLVKVADAKLSSVLEKKFDQIANNFIRASEELEDLSLYTLEGAVTSFVEDYINDNGHVLGRDVLLPALVTHLKEKYNYQNNEKVYNLAVTAFVNILIKHYVKNQKIIKFSEKNLEIITKNITRKIKFFLSPKNLEGIKFPKNLRQIIKQQVKVVNKENSESFNNEVEKILPLFPSHTKLSKDQLLILTLIFQGLKKTEFKEPIERLS